ncbi:hypothetical protein KV565_07985 [Bacillus thuringiensis]|uniref:Uncharacterized protein n=1 Tax=Bacillus wiedmannii TaxID=1890302 RepID=A0A2C4PUV2_9BACI|nr:MULTISPECIES: hypothetical protein [Bacillus]KAB2454333.1 hypothetical protein F8162_16390 [Bacillus sp. CH140a_4T]KAB2473904.1 hypothetical protein F8160_11115 [Bacillus sp. CH126_4D]MBV6705114.1 hypothetical protein [Bacillus thuringiensis]PFL82519.1 hypothetical protein COJ31_14930 [Bacillus cereus]PHD56536.1 hypothetical protein COF57_27040 [Bacillus wiedmannii]
MTEDIRDILKAMNDYNLISIYGVWLEELKARGMIRTNNVIGELGEYLAIKYYKENPKLPKLQAAPTGTQNIDAISINGDRYSIKSTTGKVTGVFYGLNEPDSEIEEKQKFEYVVIVVFNKDITLNSIYEITWENFLNHKRWHSRMRAWNLSISKALLEDCIKIF